MHGCASKVKVPSRPLLTFLSVTATSVVDAETVYDQFTFRCSAATRRTTNVM
jgi:hypothetical protein